MSDLEDESTGRIATAYDDDDIGCGCLPKRYVAFVRRFVPAKLYPYRINIERLLTFTRVFINSRLIARCIVRGES